MTGRTILAILIWGCSLSAFAINKCTAPDGKIVFQDAPCSGKGEALTVKPASGSSSRSVPSSAATSPVAPADGVFGDKWRRKTDLEGHLIRNARNDLNGHLQKCADQQRQLAAKKGQARNNLAGATWEQSISAEMQAAATTCDTRARDLRAVLESYESELRGLSATK